MVREESAEQRSGDVRSSTADEGIKDDAEAARLVGESFVPLLEGVQGFVAYYWIDAGDGLMASLSVFDDKAGADESVELAHQWIVDNVPGSSRTRPGCTKGLVVASGWRRRSSAPLLQHRDHPIIERSSMTT